MKVHLLLLYKAKQILKDMAEVGAVEYKVYFDSTFFSTNAPSVTIVPTRPAAGAKPVPGKGAAKDDAPEIKATGDPAKDNKLSVQKVLDQSGTKVSAFVRFRVGA